MEINKLIIERDLKRLEQLIDIVNFEYNLYFKGDSDFVPTMNEGLLKGLVNKYRVYQINEPSLRNKYNNLVSKYYAFKAKWKTYEMSKKNEVNCNDQLDTLIEEKLKVLNIKKAEEIKLLIYNKLEELIERGHKFDDFDITIRDNKIEVKIN
jgi:hypothetical protein